MISNAAQGNSAIIIVSDFSVIPAIVDIKRAVALEAITQVNAEYGDRLCVYAIQVGSAAGGQISFRRDCAERYRRVYGKCR